MHKDSHQDSFHRLLQRYRHFHQEITVIGAVWKESHKLLDAYSREQVTFISSERNREKLIH